MRRPSQLSNSIRQPNSNWQRLLDSFLSTLNSPGTRDNYRRAIKSAMEVMGGLESLTAEVLTKYRASLVSRLDGPVKQEGSVPGRLSTATVAWRLIALAHFLRFARLTGHVDIPQEVISVTLQSPRVSVIRPYQILTRQEQDRLLGCIEAQRDRTLIAFALATGLRASELGAVTVGDLVVDGDGDRIVHVRQGKGRKDRMVPINRETSALIKAYLAQRGITFGNAKHAEEYLFPSRMGKGHARLSTSGLRRLMAKYVRQAEFAKPISAHSLRHTATITWLKNGAPITAVRKLLGHASLETTQRYVDHLEMDELKAVVNGRRIQ